MIFVIGEALIDLIQDHEEPAKFEAVVGGANANVALALARRGAAQHFLGRISNDAFGKQIRQRLAQNGVDLSLAVSTDEPTTLAIASIDPSGSASYSFYTEGTADWGWQPAELPSVSELTARGAEAIQFGCLAMAIGPGNAVIETWLGELAATNQFTLSHDLNIRSALGFERGAELERVARVNQLAHIIKASDADLEWLFDLPVGADLDHIALDWAQGGKLVVLTRGGAGASLYFKGERTNVRAPEVLVLDTVGAGDTYMANLLAQLKNVSGLGSSPLQRLADLGMRELQSAAEVAAVAAALVCERIGCEPPTAEEIAVAIASGR
jgi:fructokinase